MKKIFLLISIFLVLVTFKSNSQSTFKSKIFDNWSLGVKAGLPMFWGDVESTFSDKIKVNTAWGFTLQKKLSSVFDFRGEFIIGSVSGSQPKYDRYFDADFYDYHFNGTLNLLNLIYGENPCRKLEVFGTLGMGFIQFRSQLKSISTDKVLAYRGFKSVFGGSGEEWETETTIITGIGFSYRLDSRFNLIAENQWHVINTDYLDSQKGKFAYDILSFTSVGITYKFNFLKNPNTFVDCTKGGNTRGKLDDGITNNYYNTKIDTAGKKIVYVNNYYYNKDTVINVINESNKIKELENKIKELENQKNANVAVNNNVPVNNDKLIELENKIKELEKQKNTNVTPAPVDNNVASSPTIDQDAMKKSILKSVMDSINNMPKPKAIYTQTTSPSTGVYNIDNLSLLSVYFDFNKSIIRESEMDKIENVAQIMMRDPNLKIVVKGHCDQNGTEPYNDGLSERRAKAVAKVLIKKYKISEDRITKEFEGKKNPLSKENSINRRVDFIKQ